MHNYVETLMAMGYSQADAEAALRSSNNNPDAAVTLLIDQARKHDEE